MTKFGLVWWNKLDAREKEAEIGALLDQGLSSTAIMSQLGLETRNRVITVRHRIKTRRKKFGISMANWTDQGSPGKRSANSLRNLVEPDVQTPPDAALYETNSARRSYYGIPFSVSTRQRRERGYQDSDFEFGGRLSPFPTPNEVSGNPNDLSRAEIHAIASLYR